MKSFNTQINFVGKKNFRTYATKNAELQLKKNLPSCRSRAAVKNLMNRIMTLISNFSSLSVTGGDVYST